MKRIKKEDLNYRADGRIEWLCEHGVGHTVFAPVDMDFVHGCDGCCKDLEEFDRFVQRVTVGEETK